MLFKIMNYQYEIVQSMADWGVVLNIFTRQRINLQFKNLEEILTLFPVYEKILDCVRIQLSTKKNEANKQRFLQRWHHYDT